MDHELTVTRDGRKLGPFTREQLRQLLDAGLVGPDDPAGDSTVAAELAAPEPPTALPRSERWALTFAFSMIPLYVAAMGVLLWAYGRRPSAGFWPTFSDFKYPKLLAFVVLTGTAYFSVKCLIWLSRDPFRAVAMGRFLYPVYTAVSVGLFVWSQWPPQLPALPGGTASLTASTLGLLQTSQFVTEPVKVLVEGVAIVLFLQATYLKLRGGRPPYEVWHFLNEVSFGWVCGDETYPWEEAPPAG